MNKEKIRQIISTVGIAGFIFFCWYYAVVTNNNIFAILSAIAILLFTDYYLQSLANSQEEKE